MPTYTIQLRSQQTGRSLSLRFFSAASDDQAKSDAGAELEALAGIVHPEALVILIKEDGSALAEIGTVDMVRKL